MKRTCLLACLVVVLSCGEPDSGTSSDTPTDTGGTVNDAAATIDTGATTTDTGPGSTDTGAAKDTGTATPDTSKKDTSKKDTSKKDTSKQDTGPIADAGPCAVNGAPCDDGDPCTSPDTCHGGKCVAGIDRCECQTTDDCKAFDDGDLCNGTLFCNKTKAPYRCLPKPNSAVICNAAKDTACAKAVCDPGTGTCKLTPDAAGTPCVDADPCTVDSVCDGKGACKQQGTASYCECKKSDDCAAKSAADKCSGVYFCNLNVFPWKCELNTTKKVTCDATKSTACETNVCDKTTGKCGLEPVLDGTPCDDGNKVTLGDACEKGACKAGSKLYVCGKDADCDPLEDGDLCNGVLYCDKNSKSCKVNPATKIVCPSVNDTACNKNRCEKTTGACNLKAEKNGTACDDGDKCTAGDLCLGGLCKAGAEFTCPCKDNADCAAKDDGNLCNGVFFCNKATKKCQFNPSETVVCPSAANTDCRKNACEPKTGKCSFGPAATVDERCDVPKDLGVKCRYEHKPKGAPTNKNVPCDDGSTCTLGDVCVADQCKPGVHVCPCKTHKDCLAHDDGNQCNGIPVCNFATGKCEKKSLTKPVFCAAINDTTCLNNVCNPASGECEMRPRNETKSCDDDDKCTVGETCGKGLCGNGKVNTCDDKDPCTQDKCDKDKGCSHPPTCNDNNDCTADTCKAGKCSFVATKLDAQSCDADGSGCTVNDACKAGKCVAGAPIQCPSPTKQCQVGVCVKTGSTTFICQAKAAADKAPCDDGQACSVGDACVGGTCTAGKGQRLFVGELAGADKYAEVHAIAGLKGGGSVLVGEVRETAAQTQAKKRRWMVWVIGADGAQKWAKPLGSASNSLVNAARAVAVEADGSLLVGGSLINKTSADVRLLKISADGSKLTGSKTYGAPNVYEELRAMLPHSGGGWVVVGTATTGKDGIRPLVMRVTLSGKVLGQRVLPLAAMVPASATSRPGGVTAAAGTGFANNKPWSWAFAVDSDLKPLWTTDLRDRMRIAHAIAATSNGYLVAGSSATQNGLRRPVFLTLDAAGHKGVRTELTTSAYPNAITATGKDSFVVVGTRPGPSLRPFIAGVDGNANHTWTLQPATTGELWAVTTHADGKVVAAGRRRGASDQKIILRALTPWGQIKCSSAGSCAGKKAGDCDDGNGCTNDFCEAKSGCLHTNNAAACDDGSVCTTKDGCVGGKCVGTSPLKCDDGNPCTADTCNGKAALKDACKHTLLNIGCDDGDLCTTGDKCLTTGCKGTPKACDDGNVCTLDGCNKLTGCKSTLRADELCDDKNPCTKDTCDEKATTLKAACEHVLDKDAPCDDGDSCTTLDQCDHLGKCSLGRAKLWSVELDSKVRAKHMLSGVAVTEKGAIFASGRQEFAATSTPRGAWIARLDAGGKVTCQNFLVDKDWSYPNLASIIADGEGAIAVGYATSKKEKSFGQRTWLVGVDAACKVTWQSHGTVFGAGYHGARASDGGVFTAGETKKGPYFVTHVARAGKKGTWRWQKTLQQVGHRRPTSIIARPDGGAVVGIGQQYGGGSPVLQVVWLDSAGNQTRSRNYTGAYSNGPRLIPDGDVLRMISTKQVALSAVKKAMVPYLGRISAASGALLGESILVVPEVGGANMVASSALKLVNGDTLFVGSFTGSTLGGEMLGIRPDGTRAWRSSTNVGNTTDYVAAAALTADGGIVAVGELHKGNRTVGTVFRFDPWGNTTCVSAGKCAQQTAKSCDDGNGCTLDSCAAKLGCTNKETKGNACDDGNPCTAAGSCNDGSCHAGAPRLFEASYQSPHSDRGIGVLAQDDGGYLAVSTLRAWNAHGANGPRGQFRKVDGSGKTVSTSWVPNMDAAAGGQAHQVTNVEPAPGGFWSLSRSSYSKTHGALQWVWHGEDGKQIKAGRASVTTWSIPKAAKICPLSDGGAMVFSSWLGWARAARVLASKPASFKVSEFGDKANVQGIGGCAQDASGRVAGVGWNHSFDGKFGAIWILGLNGTGPRYFSALALHKKASGGGKSISELHDVAAVPGGGWLAVGRTNAGHKYSSDYSGWMVFFGANAKIARQRKIGKGKWDQFAAVKRHPRGGWLLAGMSSALGNKAVGAQAWAVLTNDDGEVLWQRGYGGSGDDYFRDVTLLQDGGLALIGAKSNPGTLRDVFLVHTDPWGESSCPKSGLCAGKTPIDCDDSDLCTLDTCTLKSGGCRHDFRPDLCADQPACRTGLEQHRVFGTGKLGGSGHEAFASVVATGRIAVAAGMTETTKGDRSGVLTAFHDRGGKVFRTTAGASGTDEFAAVVQTWDRYVAAGRTNSKELGASGFDGWLQAFSKTGQRTWSRGYGGANEDELTGITTSGNKLVAVGRSKTASAGNWDGWLLVTDGLGQPQLEKRHGGKDYDGLRDVVIGKGGEIVGVGRTRSIGKQGYNGWLLRMGATDGTKVAEVVYGGDKDDALNAVAVVRGPRKVDAKTGSVLPGGVDGYLAAGSRADVGFGDGWLLRTDANGKQLWSRTYGGAAFADSFEDLVVTRAGVAVVGRTLSFGAGKTDPWLVVTSLDGATRYQRTLGAAKDDRAVSVAAADGGGYWIVGAGGSPQSHPIAWKTNAWGYHGCQVIDPKKGIFGPCARVADGQCSDGSPCTLDACHRDLNGKKGCVYAPRTGADKPGSCTALNTKDTALRSCRHQLLAHPQSRSGTYFINPTGGSGGVFAVGCDMVTDGGGWTLIMALGKDTSPKWDITTHGGGSAAQVATALFGTVTSQRALQKTTIAAIGKQGSTEYLADTGRGLFKTQISDSASFDWWRGIWDTNYFKTRVTTLVAAGNQSLSTGAPHSPASGITWLAIEETPGVWAGKTCPGEGCVYVPGLSIFEATHNHGLKNNGAGGFNAGTTGRHQSRLFIR